MTKLAQASGIETPTRADLARIDRHRKKKGSNDHWTHPHDPDATITKMKDGRTHLAHKAEHAVDLETGAIVGNKVGDIVGLYLHPPAHAAVFCVDEKPQIQALDRTQPLLPMQPGQVERRTHDYKRHGTTTLFAALNAKTSDVITQFHQRHRSPQIREFLDLIDARVPRSLDVHIIMDNYSTHKTALIRNWFAKRPRFHVHFTPTYGSWLSLVERWFAELTMKQIRRGTFRSVPQLKTAIEEFIEAHQANPKPFVWTKSADEILASIMSEWSLEHAWKAVRWSDPQAHQDILRAVASTICRCKISLGICP